MVVETVPCPACGGAGGGPLGRAGTAWDDESYVCPRCEGEGVVRASPEVPRPGIVKAAEAAPHIEKRKLAG
jgi:hypothetical protein